MEDIDIANRLFLSKKFTDALELYEKILKTDSKNLIALNNKGYTLTKLKRFEEALACYTSSLEIQSNDKTVQVNKISLFCSARTLAASISFGGSNHELIHTISTSMSGLTD